MAYDVEAIRKKLKATISGKSRDPNEFRPEKAKSPNDPPIIYVFYILPPVDVGESVQGGPASCSMENQFFITHGAHWVQDKPYPCPRVHLSENQDCEICSFGFDVLKDPKIKEDDVKRQVALRTWMPNQSYSMNIYFPSVKTNPEDLRGRTMFYNAPRTVIDLCSATLMKDDAGDPDSPEAFGVFYDENFGYMFELQVTKSGRSNSYKTSKFRAKGRPMVMNPDGSADAAGIKKLLASRFDLFTKIEAPDAAKLKRVFELMVNGDDSGDDNKRGFDVDEEEKPVVEAGKAAGKADPGTGVTTVSSKAGAVAKKPTVVAEDEDDVVSVLPKSVSVDDEEVVVAPKKKPVKVVEPLADEAEEVKKPAPAKATPAPAPKAKDEGGLDKTSIANLMDQLDDED